jgi:hypothetical protein
MLLSTGQDKYAFDRPGTYIIRILGFLDTSWSERLAGMHISTESRGELETVTTLVGLLPDQATLSGVLESLYQFQLTLLSVERLEDQKIATERRGGMRFHRGTYEFNTKKGVDHEP